MRIRRVTQLIADMARKPFNQLTILDLACGPGLYAIEAARHGATVLGIDARNDRMSEGAKVAAAEGLSASFQIGDVRDLAGLGSFDQILVLGILYHLEAAAALAMMKAVAVRTDTAIIDTHISLDPDASVTMEGWTYQGHYFREHKPEETEADRRKKLRASIDNERSFWFTRKSLTDLLVRAGFTSVMEVYAPVDPDKTLDRITIVARKGEPIALVAYPWLNSMDQAEIERRFPRPEPKRKKRRSLPRRIVGRLIGR